MQEKGWFSGSSKDDYSGTNIVKPPADQLLTFRNSAYCCKIGAPLTICVDEDVLFE